ncbi:putative E3 ubiquitin-protein ligase ipaH7.8 [compost metagenome]
MPNHPPTSSRPLPGQSSIHSELLEQLTPQWLINATPQRRAEIKDTGTRAPDWYQRASTGQQQTLKDSFNASFAAQSRLDKTMSSLQDIDTFAEPILTKALKERFGVEVDVNKTQVCLRRPLEVGVFEIEVSSFEVLKLSLLQAALHNFEASECEEGAFHRKSGFVVETSTPGTFQVATFDMTVREFLSLCRKLDIGTQYQQHIQAFFQSANAQKQTPLRDQFIASQKAAMRAAAELALLKKDIEPEDYKMILSVTEGEIHPKVGNKSVWFRDLNLMKRRMTGCVVFSISEQYRYTSDFIVYIPHDPEHPLKRYTSEQMREEFKRQFTGRDASPAPDDGPTAHQRFFSQFVAYADRPYYFSQFTRKAADSPADPLHSFWMKVVQYIPPLSTAAHIKELPPERPGKREPVDDPYLNPFGITREGVDGIWSANTDLWTYLYEQNRAKVIADARSHAVTTADVDARVRAEKLNHLLEIGMLGLNMVSMFVPVLGEIMLTVMAGQLLYESFEGTIEWSEGDRIAAKGHLVDVAENLALIAVMAGGGKGLPESIFEGHERLWSGLSLEWSNFMRENFKPAYEYVKNHPAHLVDLEEMVRGYSKGELKRLGNGINDSFDGVFNQFAEQWQGAEARFAAVETLSEQYSVLDRQLDAWSSRAIQTPMIKEMMGRSWAKNSLKDCWRNGVFKRYGSTGDASVLNLPNLELSELPELPAGAFPHVQTLYLKGSKAPVEQIRGFVAGFTELQRLDLSRNGLTEVPIAPGELGQLIHLNLSDNNIGAGSAAPQYIEGLQALEYLDLRNNPLQSLDVSALTRLKALSLRGTNLHQWPIGSQNLPELTWLDLRDSQLSELPEQLADDMLLKTNLIGTPLTVQSIATLKLARQRVELAKGLPLGTLERFDLEEVPTVFPPSESGGSIARHLLPLTEVPVGEGPAVLTNRLQRLKPDLADEAAVQVIAQMRAIGLTEVQLSERLAEWEQTFEMLTRRLNGWLYTRGMESIGWMAPSGTRRLGALRILECWREGLIRTAGSSDGVLDLNGLQLDDLPELPVAFDHVGTLNLTGLKLTAQGSDGFLRAFTQLKTLELNGNGLDRVPDPVQQMSKLERLEMSSNLVRDNEQLYASLGHLERLKWLDLGHNELDTFDVGSFEALETLDLRNNNLTEWPDGVLDSYRLRTLNLSGNDITSIPEQALDGSHEVLLGGIDLSDNYNLSLESLERLRTYREQGLHETVLGFTRADLDELIDDAHGFDEEDSETIESDEELTENEPDAAQKEPWLANAPPEELAGKSEIWNQLAAEPDNAAFFHLIARLQDTQEFRVANADLTRRVWTVMDAAASNTELREVLFASSATHGTCVDGRILTFSGLESKVFTHNALLDIPVGGLSVKGEALLKLSRQLFRLDKVDELATKATRTGQDEAEVRLGYRIGLTNGWDDGLSLPGQPKHMTYASGVTPRQMAEMRTEILNAERSDTFLEDLIQRDYWVNYLKEKYPEVFQALDEMDVQEEVDNADEAAFLSQLFEQAAARNAKMIALSRQEVAEFAGGSNS